MVMGPRGLEVASFRLVAVLAPTLCASIPLFKTMSTCKWQNFQSCRHHRLQLQREGRRPHWCQRVTCLSWKSSMDIAEFGHLVAVARCSLLLLAIVLLQLSR